MWCPRVLEFWLWRTPVLLVAGLLVDGQVCLSPLGLMLLVNKHPLTPFHSHHCRSLPLADPFASAPADLTAEKLSSTIVLQVCHPPATVYLFQLHAKCQRDFYSRAASLQGSHFRGIFYDWTKHVQSVHSMAMHILVF